MVVISRGNSGWLLQYCLNNRFDGVLFYRNDKLVAAMVVMVVTVD